MNNFENEIEPALLLSMYSQDELGLEIDIKKNDNDPPDYFATINGKKKINLELTQLAGYLLHEKNSFLEQIGVQIQKGFNKYKKELPDGIYSATYEIGQTILNDGWKYTEMKSNNKIAKSNLNQQINACIKSLTTNFTDYTESNKIENKQGEQIGIIHLTFKNKADKSEVYIFPQKLSVSHTDSTYIYKTVQQIIDDKEKKYEKKYSRSNKDWWLLIHDLKDYLNINLFADDIGKHKFTFEFFSKVLIIRPGYPSYKITDLAGAT